MVAGFIMGLIMGVCAVGLVQHIRHYFAPKREGREERRAETRDFDTLEVVAELTDITERQARVINELYERLKQYEAVDGI